MIIDKIKSLFKQEERIMYIYPKDHKGNRTGTTICVIARDGKIYYGEALTHPKDQFNKRDGRLISYARARAFINRKYY
jgi:hypothetical protein